MIDRVTHRGSAEAARAAAAETELPNVRARNLRSADAHEAAANREERSAASLKKRQAETAARKAEGIVDHDDDIQDGDGLED